MLIAIAAICLLWILPGYSFWNQAEPSAPTDEALGSTGHQHAARENPASSVIVIGKFGPEHVGKFPPEGWEELTFNPDKFPKKSRYDVIRTKERFVLRARTNGGASAIYKRVEVAPQKYPYIVWHWRVDQIFAKADERTKRGDDYPARLYIGFRYDPSRVGLATRAAFRLAKARSKDGRYPPLYVLNYVWAHKLERNTWISNPWQDRSKMIAVRSGKKGIGSWHREARDYVRDFKAIVGEEPPPVEFVAIMIDGDGTRSKGVSYFDSIELRRELPPGLEVGHLPLRKR